MFSKASSAKLVDAPVTCPLFFFSYFDQNWNLQAWFSEVIITVGRDSSVDIATRYGLEGPFDRIPVGKGRDFPP